MELRLPLEMSPGREAACRAVFGTWGFFPNDARKNCPFVLTSFTGWSSERCPGIVFLSRGDREIGVLRNVEPPTRPRLECLRETGLILRCDRKVGNPFQTKQGRGDASLVREGLKDVLIEPRRAPLIPHFAQVKQAALDHHAMGASISGAGPSVFGWYEDRAEAEAAGAAMREAFATAGLDSDVWVSPINGPAASLVASAEILP